jgi:uncharacterized protein (TIGR00369 family)
MNTELQSDPLERFIQHSDYLSWIGLQLKELRAGAATVVLPADERLFNPAEGTANVMNGGVVATLIDMAGGFALWTTCDDPERIQLTTTDMNISYLRPATDDLVATSEVVRSGNSLGVAEISIESDETDSVVATGRTTYRIETDEDER